MKPKSFFAVLSTAAVVGGALFFLFSGTPSQGEATVETPVRTATIAALPFQETAEFSGFVRGVRQADIAPKTSGYVVKLLKEEGEAVRSGEVIAILDGAELSSVQKSALLSLEAFGRAIKESERYYDQKVDEAKTARDDASENERTAAEEALKSAKRLRDAELASLQSQRATLEGAVIVSEASVRNLTVRAPFAGIVIRKDATLGAFVAAGMPLYTIASPEAVEIAVSLPASIAAGITKGATVRVSSDAGTTEGSVYSIVSAADMASQRSTARIRFTAAADAATFRLGAHVRVIFPIGSERTALLVPESAIVSAYDDTFVYRVEAGVAKRAAVTLGKSDTGGQREILSGIRAGEHIVIAGQHTLSDNQPVSETYADR